MENDMGKELDVGEGLGRPHIASGSSHSPSQHPRPLCRLLFCFRDKGTSNARSSPIYSRLSAIGFVSLRQTTTDLEVRIYFVSFLLFPFPPR